MFTCMCPLVYDGPMGKPFLAVITDERHGRIDEEEAVLQPLGVRIVIEHCKNSADVARACAQADAVLVNMAPVDALAIAAMERCKVICRYGVGTDNVDKAAAAARGIAVANVPGYCDNELAEHALALMLSLLRALPAQDAAMRKGAKPTVAKQSTLFGSVVGVAGFGGSGKALCRLLIAHRPQRLLVWSRSLNQNSLVAELGQLAALYGVELSACSFDQLVAHSDILSLNLALGPETRHILPREAIARCKTGMLLVNTARGALVDQEALAQALASGQIGGAGLDVLSQEPPSPGDAILLAPNVILSGHTAYRSDRSLSELKTRCAQNAARGLGLIE